MFIGFCSDNASGVHPRILEAISRVNTGYCKPYGDDEYSELANTEFRKLFGDNIAVFFGLNGTGTNVMALRSLLRPWQSVICAETAHINTDESGAPEFATGAKLLCVPTADGKICPSDLDRWLPDIESFHRNTPKVVSITQSTEVGTVYSVAEISALADKAHANGMYLHMDGTRLANAVACLNADIRAVTKDSGVDVLSFGGAKNGLLLAEAIIFFRPELANDFRTIRKQSLQMASKMRFVAAQFIEALKDGLWLEMAEHANNMANILAKRLADIPYMQVQKPQVNSVFVSMDKKYREALQKDYYFYQLDPGKSVCRLMCSWATTLAEIEAFVQTAKGLA